MQWSDGANAGFSPEGSTPWLPINENFVTLNVETESEEPTSHLEIYRALVRLR